MENKILLLVDNPELKTTLAKELAKWPYQISSSEENVLQEVFHEVPHLIIIDEDFKQGRGRTFALNIKEDLVLKYIPIILLVQKEEVLPREKSAKIDLYFAKDHNTEKLITCVTETLTKSSNELDLNPLTRLPGTPSSVLRIERAIRSKKLFSVCCVDLSRFAAYNKLYGYARGDRVIVRLGQIIQDAVKKHGSEDDFIGHLGGDDFIVLTQPALAAPVAEAIIKSFDAGIANFYDLPDRARGTMALTLVIIPNENIPLFEISTISRIAGELNKYLKSFPDSCYIEYYPRVYVSSPEKGGASMEVSFPGKRKSVKLSDLGDFADKTPELLNLIIEEKRIQTVYQPIVELRARKIIGYEALTRSLTGGYLDDSDATVLFNMARDEGRIKELDRLCIEHALEEAQGLDPGRKLFLNLNHEALIDRQMMKDLFSQKGKIAFSNIVIEITEQSIMRSFEKIREALLGLKEQGVSIAIDDLGGGAVSLRDVAILKPDYIKFDKSLIRQIDSNITKQQIVLSMILFANGIQAVTTAEGIETKREYETVMMLGIGLGQGYYFARPSKSLISSLPELP